MRRSTFVLSLVLGVALLLGIGGSASAQAVDLAECRGACRRAPQAARDQCNAIVPGRVRGYCKRGARAYDRCCKRKLCRGRVADVASCIRSPF